MLPGSDVRIAVIGLGYVGLPLAVAFSRRYAVTGFDINKRRIQELKDAYDTTKEISRQDLREAANLTFSWDEATLKACQVFIVTVPTPVDHYKKPNLTYLLKASAMIGQVLKKGDLVIYESTVYPGCTEDDCVPVLERESGLKFNEDFFCGYSPERINPGDKVNTFTKIKKVTSGSTPEIARIVDELYASVIEAGTHRASSIKVAEASKAIENAQRDVNISFVNELALIFDRMNIDTTEVLEAAATKWNFLQYKPGLVGGHCIGVDPYYLAYKAESLGYYPQVILSGRRVNDMMGVFVANKLVKLMIRKGHKIEGSRVLVLGITFKENCPDIRNTRVIDVYRELTDFGMQVEVHDPWASGEQVLAEYDIALLDKPSGRYEAVILAVAHQEFRSIEFSEFTAADSVIFDLKSVLPQEMVDSRL
ncbi:nucleotide sugar dehydrogenase [Dyadobacter fermentans]|uniref:Nucleotide sugar dehydrogenase n=1 Tax=Dyadobacter fermentans (strain ATCC 700827 / DSM 18053 / CIP 107007 / KCTC 52180 / NS114) TaxID=471854 RepID=C6W5Q0_DYAFD|nr:nucleotide sugar dehydrogenase [Dyadobacter fermentans]ACT95989.1 nucleotide sugar dehydrogenase [Dyadobacter fermentans DSM 18053]